MADFTTYRDPAPLFDVEEIALENDDILLSTYPVSTSKVYARGILAVAPHISLQTAGPLTYRAALEHDCTHVTGLAARSWQLDVSEQLSKGHDVVVQAMTGAGKSLPFILPVLANPSRFVIIASPLNILQAGMAETFEKYGLKCVVYNADSRNDQTHAVRLDTVARRLANDLQILRHRDFHVLFAHPEELTKNGGLHAFLADPIWTSTCTSFVVDESHLIVDWGLSKFRPAYATLGQLRSYFDVPILAVSATLAPTTVVALADLLHLSRNYVYLNLGNARDNLFWEVREVGGAVAAIPSLRFLFPAAVSPQTIIPQTLIFVPSRPIAHRVANYLRSLLPKTMQAETVVPLHAFMRARRKQRIIDQFDTGFSRIMVCTTVAALGRDFRNVTRVIGFQLPDNIEAWVQEAGRGARDPSLTCHAILLVQHGAYTLKAGAVAEESPSDSDSDSDYEVGGAGAVNPPLYPENATPDMFKKALQPAFRSFVAPLSSFRPTDPCRCELMFRYFGNPGEVKMGLCDVCRARGRHIAEHTPAIIEQLTLPAGALPRPPTATAQQTRAPPKRKGPELAVAHAALSSWRFATYKRLFMDSGLPIEALMPQAVLDSIASTLKLFHVEDLQRLSPAWSMLPQFGRGVLDVMHKVQSDEAAATAERKRAAADKKVADAAAEAAALEAQADRLRKAREVHSANSAIRRTMPKPEPEAFVGAAEGTRARAAVSATVPLPTGSSSTTPTLPVPPSTAIISLLSPKHTPPRKRKARAPSSSPQKTGAPQSSASVTTPKGPKRKRSAVTPPAASQALSELTNSPKKNSKPASPTVRAPKRRNVASHPAASYLSQLPPDLPALPTSLPSLLHAANIVAPSAARVTRSSTRKASAAQRR